MHWKRNMRKIFAMMIALCMILTQNQMLVSADEISKEQGVRQESVSDMNGVITPFLTDDAEWITDEEYDGEVSLYGLDEECKGSVIYDNEWDKYSTNYYYNQMTTGQKKLWDTMNQMCNEYLTTTKSVTTTPFTYQIANTECKYSLRRMPAISYSGLSSEQVTETFRLFLYSNPQFYFLYFGGSISAVNSSSGKIGLMMYDSFANGTTRANVTSKIKNKLETWMTQMNAESTDVLKEKKAHDLICLNTYYDPNYLTASQEVMNQNVYSVFVKGVTVCAGYSAAMQMLMNGVGIDCTTVTSSNHAWNLIQLKQNWYQVDVTWDDNGKVNDDTIRYYYFNRSYQVYQNDTENNRLSHTPEMLWDGKLPALVKDSGATLSDIGTIEETQGTTATPVISSSDVYVTIKSSSGGDIYYTLDGTTPSQSSGKSYRYTGKFALKKTTTVKAIAVKAGYKDSTVATKKVTPRVNVTYQANGGYIGKAGITSHKVTYDVGETLNPLPTAKRKGYVFLGWYTKKENGTKITNSTKLSKGGSLYAHWKKNQPKKISITSLKNNTAGAIRLKLEKVSTASGYQIKIALKPNMSGAKSYTLSSNGATVQRCTKGRTYYFQARIYQKDSATGKKVYGTWSSIRKITVKK